MGQFTNSISTTGRNPGSEGAIERRCLTLREEFNMGIQDKGSNKAQDLKGKGKEAAGKATGDKDLERKGKADEVKSAAKDAGEKVKDTASKAKDAITDR